MLALNILFSFFLNSFFLYLLEVEMKQRRVCVACFNRLFLVTCASDNWSSCTGLGEIPECSPLLRIPRFMDLVESKGKAARLQDGTATAQFVGICFRCRMISVFPAFIFHKKN